MSLVYLAVCAIPLALMLYARAWSHARVNQAVAEVAAEPMPVESARPVLTIEQMNVILTVRFRAQDRMQKQLLEIIDHLYSKLGERAPGAHLSRVPFPIHPEPPVAS